ncbi:MAG: DUF3868 domain-containing protein [Mediterranea sp.]|jgi:outer membrane protein OmpA-like peptidoglycan-associated protein|nr:DUF3868 domain-containing protein [Mediterranea sp.]
MKRFILLSIFLIAAVSFAVAQDYDVAIRNAVVAKEGDKLKVSFTMEDIDISSRYRALITPVIYDGTGQMKELKPVLLVGKNRNTYDKRSGNTTPNIERHVVKKHANISYTDYVTWEDWMQYVSIAISETIEGCCTTVHKAPNEAVAEGLLTYFNKHPYYNIKPLPYELSELEKYDIDNPFLHSMEDFDKRYDVLKKNRGQGSAKIVFKVGSSVIDLGMADNQTMMSKMLGAFRVIENDSLAVLRKIVIAAYASPEGTLAYNTKLAAARASAVEEHFLQNVKGLDANMFELINGREDWDGLREAVEASEMEAKADVLKIIDSYSMEQEIRKTKLKQLDGGKPYKYMLENLYPPLRNGGYLQIYYEVQRKASLSWTDEQGRQVWVDPDSPRNRFVSAYNKSIGLLVDGSYKEALDVLLPYKDDSRSWNYIGVAYMMIDENTTAASYFQKAADNGDTDALRNLEELKWDNKVMGK